MKELLFEPVILVSLEEVECYCECGIKERTTGSSERKSKPKETPFELPLIEVFDFSSDWFYQGQSWWRSTHKTWSRFRFPKINALNSIPALAWFHIWEETTKEANYMTTTYLGTGSNELLAVVLCLSQLIVAVIRVSEKCCVRINSNSNSLVHQFR